MSAATYRRVFVSLFLFLVCLLFKPFAAYADNLPPVADAGQDIETAEAQYASFSASGSTDPDGPGDIVSCEWDFGDDGTGGSCSESHRYIEDGIYTVTLTVTDSEAHTDSDTLVVTVDNVAASIGGFYPDVSTALPQELVTVHANFSDDGVTDTHTASWDWGDGNTSEADVTEDNGSGTASGSHSYETPGEYSITLTVVDSGEAEASLPSTAPIIIEEE